MKSFVIGLAVFALGVFLFTHEAEHTITDYSEWCSYLDGEDIAADHSAWWELNVALKVDVNAVRAGFVKSYEHWATQQYGSAGRQVAWVDGNSRLHLLNPSGFTRVEAKDFTGMIYNTLKDMFEDSGTLSIECIWPSMALLFRSIIIHNSTYDLGSNAFKTDTTEIKPSSFEGVFKTRNRILKRGRAVLE